MRRAALLAATGLLLAGCSGGSGGQATSTAVVTETQTVTVGRSSIADTVARVLPSVVNVRTSTFSGDQGEGSGAIIDRSGIIVTNNHVVEGAQTVTVAFTDAARRRPLQGQVVGTAPERDLAIIKVKARGLVPVRIGRSSSLRLGDGVVAIGFPLDLGGGPTVTQGIVSGLKRTIEPRSGTRLEGLLQTDAAINPGNSGGPLVDLSGRLVGINTAAALAGVAENIGFAIAIDEALPVIREIRSKPPDKRAWLGLSLASVDSAATAAQLGLDPGVRGAAVAGVYPSSPAARAGFQQGDVIVGIGRRAIRSSEDVLRILTTLDPGQAITLEVVDSEGSRRVPLTLARRPTTLPR